METPIKAVLFFYMAPDYKMWMFRLVLTVIVYIILYIMYWNDSKEDHMLFAFQS